ncbi:amidohydrolase family protein [Arthrobacter jiangjiafuii]|uniref:amidohydrolase family protein n=1 Tax=Arthrobacter jiangjiafuii TaxID=2817475 RepID=UPI003080D436
MPDNLLLKNASLPKTAGRFDVLLSGGIIAALVPAGSPLPDGPGLGGHGGTAVVGPGTQTHDLDGRYVIPGLWDNHVHFGQWVTRQQRLDLSATASAADVLDIVRSAAGGRAEMLVGFGFRDALWPDSPTLAALDSVSGSTPVVLISGDLHCLWVNSAALGILGLPGAGPPGARDGGNDDGGVGADGSGLLREGACFEALEKLQDPTQLSHAAYARAAEAAARRGVVGIVDFENTDNVSQWPERIRHGVDSLRVEVSVWPDRLDAAIRSGVKTGDVLDSRGLVTMGPLKVIVDGSLNTRTAWCWDPYPGLPAAHPHACGVESVPLAELQELMAAAHGAGLAAAIHAIGDRANTAVLDAFEALGMPGVIEHAQLVSEQDFARFKALGLAASVQPEHAMDDRDVADAFWAGRTGRAFALASLHRAGAELRLGSDAPVAPLDPWFAIASAVGRSRDGRAPWHSEQCITAAAALTASTRGRSAVSVRDVADVVVVEKDPLTVPADQLRTMPVSATLLGGRFTWSDL